MVHLGLERFLENPPDFVTGRRLGLITNHTGLDRHLRSGIEQIRQHPELRVQALYAPEHGVRGEKQAGEAVDTYVDPKTNITVHSLYGTRKRLNENMLQNVEVLVVHLQDGGARYWTYLYTMGYALEAAADYDIPIIVLDRPNPIGGLRVEGNILSTEYKSFVGAYPIPMRHGLTMGEAALLFNREFGIDAELTVVAMQGWKREQYFEDTGIPWVPASPNTPRIDTLIAYPGTCLFEGTNLSEGRGTTMPFEWLGAPWLDGERWSDALNALELPGVIFRPVSFTPTFSKHQGKLCHGVQVHVTDRGTYPAVSAGLHLLASAKAQAPEHFRWLPPPSERPHRFIDLLAGTDTLADAIDAGIPPTELLERWEAERNAFAPLRNDILLYT